MIGLFLCNPNRMTQTIEERKQEFRDSLKLSLISFKNPRFSRSRKPDILYRSTWEIANTPPYFQSSEEIFFVRNDWRGTIIGSFFIIVAIVLSFIVDFDKHAFSILVLIFFAIAGGKILITALDKRIKIEIDRKGIFYYKWLRCIEWSDVVATYIEENKEDEYTIINLLIYFHDVEDDTIKQKLVPLDGLKTDMVEVSFFVEYIKLKAGFPTEPSHY